MQPPHYKIFATTLNKEMLLVTPPTNKISLLGHARERINLVLRWLDVGAGRGGVV